MALISHCYQLLAWEQFDTRSLREGTRWKVQVASFDWNGTACLSWKSSSSEKQNSREKWVFAAEIIADLLFLFVKRVHFPRCRCFCGGLDLQAMMDSSFFGFVNFRVHLNKKETVTSNASKIFAFHCFSNALVFCVDCLCFLWNNWTDQLIQSTATA